RGYRVAVCEEGDPDSQPAPLPGEGGRADGGSILRRGVVRTLTPGTVTDPRLLREDRPTYLLAVAAAEERVGLAWADVAAGEFRAGEFAPDEAAAEIERLDPAEVLLPSDRRVPDGLLTGHNVTPLGPSEE